MTTYVAADGKKFFEKKECWEYEFKLVQDFIKDKMIVCLNEYFIPIQNSDAKELLHKSMFIIVIDGTAARCLKSISEYLHFSLPEKIGIWKWTGLEWINYEERLREICELAHNYRISLGDFEKEIKVDERDS